MTKQFDITIEADTESGGFVVWVPEIPGCISQGETVEECMENIKDAIRLFLLEEKKRKKYHRRVTVKV